ncbi:hypothetical protein BH11PLA2_BH11PLA2_20720 [soil metagenome]
MAAITTTSAGPTTAVPGANRMLMLLLFINLFNYIDRQVLSAVLPRLQRDASIISLDDPNAQLKLGLLTSAFMATYMTLSLLFGWLDGRGAKRWVLLGVGVTLWSLASGSSGLATGYWMLLATRCLVGVGEAAYGPIASAMIADMYPVSKRGKILAIFNVAIPVGSALGFIIGGQIAEAYGWRHAFWVTYSGLFLGLLCFFKKDPPRPVVEATAKHVSYMDSLKELSHIRSFVLCCLGMTAVVFVTGGIGAWVPAYVFERDSRFVITAETLKDLQDGKEADKREPLPAETVDKLKTLIDGTTHNQAAMKKFLSEHLDQREQILYSNTIFDTCSTADSPKLGTLTTIFGGILVLGGILATIVGAWLGERLRPKTRGAYFKVIGFGTLLGLPAYFGILYAPFPLAWVFIFLTIFFLFLYTGPANTILANVTHSNLRATGFAINILVIHLLGDAISPSIIGFVADQSNLQFAFLLMSVMIVIGGVLWLMGAKHLDADTEAALAKG